MATRAASIGSILLTIALIGGCGGDDDTSAPPPPPASTSTAPPEPEPLQVYRRYNEISNAAAAEPNRDWTAEIEAVSADPDRFLFKADIARMRDNNSRQVGKTKIDPVLVSLESPRAVIDDCYDISGAHRVQNGQGLERAPDQLERYKLEVIVELYENPDRWLVQQVNPKRAEPC